MNDFTWVAYPVPNDWVRIGLNTVEISMHKLNPQMSEKPVLNNLELLLEFNRALAPPSKEV